jgi:hypothetical protein
MEAKGKLAPMKMPCTHIWEIDPAAGPTSKGKCRLCGTEKDFANSLPEETDPHERAKIRLKGSQPKPGKGVEEMPTVDVNARGKELAPIRRAAVELFRKGKTVEELRQMPGFKDVAPSTLSGWRGRFGPPTDPEKPPTAKRKKESTTVRTSTLAASGRHAQDKSTDAPASGRDKNVTDFVTNRDNIGELLIGVGLVIVGSWLKRMEGNTDGGR